MSLRFIVLECEQEGSKMEIIGDTFLGAQNLVQKYTLK